MLTPLLSDVFIPPTKVLQEIPQNKPQSITIFSYRSDLSKTEFSPHLSLLAGKAWSLISTYNAAGEGGQVVSRAEKRGRVVKMKL